MRAAIRFTLLFIATCAVLPAAAQTVPTPSGPTPPTTDVPATPPHHHRVKPAKSSAQAVSATVVAKPGGNPVVPAAPPPVAVIPPPDAAPPHPTAPPPPPPVHPDAPGESSKIDNGLRLTFGDNRADFNPATDQALQILAHTGQGSPSVIFNLYAHAAGGPDDTSTPRRLSLQRALAVRSALINAGIASTRIYVHAMGSNGTDTGAPADRVDITLANLDSAAAPTPGSSAAATP